MLSRLVTDDLEATLPIEVSGPVGRRTLTAVIDTGFNGFLSLPSDVVTALGLQFSNKVIAELGDGSFTTLDKYAADVRLHGDSRRVLILQADGGPLIGMAMLEGLRLTMSIRRGGPLAIEPDSGSSP